MIICSYDDFNITRFSEKVKKNQNYLLPNFTIPISTWSGPRGGRLARLRSGQHAFACTAFVGLSM